MLVSAAIADGPPARVLDQARAGAFELVVPDLVREELLRVLATKLAWEREELIALDAAVEQLASEAPAVPVSGAAVTGDPSDDRILACAISSEADVLVSGDRQHLLPLARHGELRIMTPQRFLAELGG